jgi:hypothetical protein
MPSKEEKRNMIQNTIMSYDFSEEAQYKYKVSEYNEQRATPENFSYWFPKIEKCGMRMPESKFYIIPQGIYVNSIDCIYDSKTPTELINWLTETVIPDMHPYKNYFLKNGTFSNKFDFRDCVANRESIIKKYLSIQYGSCLLSAGGTTEIVLRKHIDYSEKKHATIYNGMPLRVEIRVFYDFDKHEVIYAANYWDYNYVAPHMYNRTDEIVFNHVRKEIENGFAAHRLKVEAEVAACMHNVSGLNGIWSVDIMVDDRDQYWLIDMARGENSAFKEGLYDEDALKAFKSGKSPYKPYVSPEIYNVPEMGYHTTNKENVIMRRQGEAIAKYIYQTDICEADTGAENARTADLPLETLNDED